MRAEDGAVLGGRAVATPLAASGSSAQTTRTHGLWNQHSALTWVLLGIVVAFIAFVALVVFSPDTEAPPAAEKAATVAAPAAASTSPTSGVIAGGKGMETSPAPEDVALAAKAIAAIPEETWVNDSFEQLNNFYALQERGNAEQERRNAEQERGNRFLNSRAEEEFRTRAVRLAGEDFAVLGPVLKRLADGGDAKAAYLYARALEIESEDTADENAFLATQYFQQAADGGIPAAMAQLVWRYHIGEGALPDQERALDQLAKARSRCNRWRFPGVPGESKHPIPARCLPPRP